MVIRVITSGRNIHLDEYKEVCHKVDLLGILVRHHFPWAAMNQTLHSILAHSWEVIQNNESKGLKEGDREFSKTHTQDKIHKSVDWRLSSES